MSDKPDTVPGLGFKDQEKAQETLKNLEGRDPDYQKLAIKGLIGRAKRTLTLTKDKDKLQNITDAISVFEQWLKDFESNNLAKENRPYLPVLSVKALLPLKDKYELKDELAERFLKAYSEEAKGEYKNLRTISSGDGEPTWDIVRNKQLKTIPTSSIDLWDDQDLPTKEHMELVLWAYSPEASKIKKNVSNYEEKLGNLKIASDEEEAKEEKKGRKRKSEGSSSSSQSEESNASEDDESPKKKSKKAEEDKMVPLTDNSLVVDISDALSEKDKVKFTVHTRTTMNNFQKLEFLVVRQHEEFIWLHDRFEEEPKYAGYIIPPPPPRPNFDASREKLQRLGEGEGTMTKEEFTKMKQELEAEYLATFKKTVAMHEVFLTRLACHSVFREDSHLHVFLEYDQDLCARPKGKLQQLGGLVKSLGSTTDQYYLNATVRDVNDFFEQQMVSLTEYHTQLRDATGRTDRMTEKHKELADSYIKISSGLLQLANSDNGHLDKFFARKVESRVASDQDLKLADTLRYYMRDSQAAKSLLVRRLKCLANYENANRALEKARHKNKDIHA
ncbi:hypothetical protein D910_05691, partial [Dendroctonus ponderosae]